MNNRHEVFHRNNCDNGNQRMNGVFTLAPVPSTWLGFEIG